MIDKSNKKSKTGMGVTTEVPDENVRIVKIPKRTAVEPQKVYDDVYVPNMKRRGLETDIKPYSDWVRSVKSKDSDGNEVRKEVPGDTGESKEEKGTRLLTNYFNSAVDALDRIKNLSSPQYKLSEKQVKLMHDKLTEKISEIDNTFAGKSKESEPVDFSKVE